MKEYRYTLDKSCPRIKFTCPRCGHPKKLVRYIDTQGEISFPEYVGRCDRQFKCGYHYTPSDYFRDNSWLHAPSQPPHPVAASPAPHRPVSFIDPEVVEQSLGPGIVTPLHSFLSTLWGEDETRRLFALYRVGTNQLFGGSVVFWQTDIDGYVRTGKIMRYGNDGHRVRTDGLASFHWAHRINPTRGTQPDFNLRQCFFGEHLLREMPLAKVMIVESEKSAIIAAHFYPEYVWLASGGCSGCLNETAAQVLRGREVWLIPDLDAEDKWEAKLPMLRKITSRAALSRFFSDLATPRQRAEKLDIADFLLLAITPVEASVDTESKPGQLAEKQGGF